MEPAAASETDLRKQLFAECERYGGVRAFARARGVCPSAVCKARGGGALEPSIINALGYIVRTEYVKVRS